MKWKILNTEYLIKRPWLTARRDTVQLPDGRINPEYYILEYPTWVNVIAITSDGDYIMVQQYRHGLSDVFVELVAGVVEPNEEPLAAARRELLEEAGYSGGEWELLTVIAQNPASTNNLTYCYVAKNVVKTHTQKLDATEDIEVKHLSEAELKGMLLNDEMKQSLMLAPLWKHFYLKENPHL